MYKLFLTFLCLFSFALYANSAVTGGVQKNEQLENYNQIIDAKTGKGIPHAKVSAPALKFKTITDNEGKFNLKAKVNGPTILSVQKDGYKPFSMTISENGRKPLIIGIEKTQAGSISIETDMIHLGDNSYSMNSANAYDFSARSSGAFYTKEFKIPKLSAEQNAFLSIGSVIGIDTITAVRAGQSKVRTTYASAPEIYCNGNKICELNINGDNQEIEIPKGLLKQGQRNTVTIKSGKNLFQTSYIDYDDIEFTNLSIEIR
ncbi:MAG: carboxypeptidase-like regulatory domain-containing protein [Candidatus Gastranaerophilales bacterium]|nr:carboxypeptidase-like regulatory domain-containing protein [Candidatus Gastranaerophilales bacterium]